MFFLTTRHDFPFDTTRALELALFRTFAMPSVGALLHRTGEFERRAQKRYDDTDLLLSEVMEWGYDSDRGRAALKRVNEIHGRFRIAHEDFLYVLSTFVFEPIRFNARFGWRRLTEAEKQAMFYFWREVGRRMGIHDIPATLEAFQAFSEAYERDRFRATDAGRRVGLATRELFAGWFPRPVRPLIRQAIYALLDDRTREAFGFPPAHPLFRRLVPAALVVRAYVLRWVPRRRRPLLRTARQTPTYPRGYRVEQLGP